MINIISSSNIGLELNQSNNSPHQNLCLWLITAGHWTHALHVQLSTYRSFFLYVCLLYHSSVKAAPFIFHAVV